jgi:hypothetical protein
MTTPPIDNPRMDTDRQGTLATLLRATCAFGFVALTPACVLFTNPEGVAVSSDPPGATVFIAGKDTGYVTPCVIGIDPDDDTRVDIALKGHVTETRFISSNYDVYALLWREMSVGFDTWDFPLFVDLRDFFTPVKIHERVVPGRIHVKLDRTADKVASSPQ